MNSNLCTWVFGLLVGLAAASCGKSNGNSPDGGARDGGSDGGGDSCLCTNEDGPCCDGCNYYATNDDQECETVSGYRCADGGCGADAMKHTGTRVCQGGTSACTGEVAWGAWGVYELCGVEQICKTDSESFAECATCGFHCQDDACLDCQPGTCCEADGTSCKFGCDTGGDGECWPECDPTGSCCDPDGTACPACDLSDGTCWPECVPGSDACCEADGTMILWYDSANDLCWENPSGTTRRSSTPSASYCSGLGSGWRLPKIQELISLIQGCGSSTCPVTDPGCLNGTCASSCASCAALPNSGCYWDPALGGACDWAFWSSSIATGIDSEPWLVYFSNGQAFPNNPDGLSDYYVRCVRSAQ
jgi:hypothetical protein